ncbi:MAG: PEP-CTERM sorting domain-containing protein, partial [Pirellulales bacterium]|nr:PEP-CTERM sorting domain-containing protein [Pirellulales bacterium]
AVVPEPETFLLFFLASAGFRRTAGQKRQELINE